MTKFLICGDTHLQDEVLDSAHTLYKALECDKLILMGDYMDDWGDTPEMARRHLTKLMDMLTHDENIIALIGNHDMAYVIQQLGYGWTAPKQRAWDETINISRLQVAFQHDSWLFTHAGLTRAWAKYASNLDVNTKRSNGVQEFIDRTSFYNDEKWLADYFYRYPGVFRSIGPARGGFGKGSPTWADWSELIADPIEGRHQIVGHTPQEKSQYKFKKGSHLICCDTWSNGNEGDFLLWEDGSVYTLDSTGRKTSQLVG